jgi:hypothetical protein
MWERKTMNVEERKMTATRDGRNSEFILMVCLLTGSLSKE